MDDTTTLIWSNVASLILLIIEQILASSDCKSSSITQLCVSQARAFLKRSPGCAETTNIDAGPFPLPPAIQRKESGDV